MGLWGPITNGQQGRATVTRNEARDILSAVCVLDRATPRQIKRIRYGRVPYIRAGLVRLAAVGAVEKTSADTWETGPKFDEVFAAASWDKDDGTPQPKWEV